MDVGAPSNWERIQALFDWDDDALRGALVGTSISDETTRGVMRRLHQDHGYLADPHTAVAWAAAEAHAPREDTVVCLGTAHPAKFKGVVDEALGLDIPLPPELARVVDIELLSEDIPADLGQLVERL